MDFLWHHYRHLGDALRTGNGLDIWYQATIILSLIEASKERADDEQDPNP